MISQHDREIVRLVEQKRVQDPLYSPTIEEAAAIERVEAENKKSADSTLEANTEKEQSNGIGIINASEHVASVPLFAKKQPPPNQIQASQVVQQACHEAFPQLSAEEQARIREEFRITMCDAIVAEYGQGTWRSTEAKMYLNEFIKENQAVLNEVHGYAQLTSAEAIKNFMLHEKAAYLQQEAEIAAHASLTNDNQQGISR